MNIDFNACATFKGENQRPLWTERLVRLGRSRPSIREIAETASRRGLDGVVLRSFSHPEGTDNRWQAYKQQMRGQENFTYLGNGVALYTSPDTKKKIVLIHGQGLMTSEGNIQVLFAEDQVGGRGKDGFNMNFYDTVHRARQSSEGAIIIAARPYNWNLEALEHVDAVEVWNGMDSSGNNRRAQGAADVANKPGVYASNSKCLHDLGTSYTNIDVGFLPSSSPGIACAINAGLDSRLNREDLGGKKGKSTLSKLVQLAAIAEVKLTGNKD